MYWVYCECIGCIVSVLSVLCVYCDCIGCIVTVLGVL